MALVCTRHTTACSWTAAIRVPTAWAHTSRFGFQVCEGRAVSGGALLADRCCGRDTGRSLRLRPDLRYCSAGRPCYHGEQRRAAGGGQPVPGHRALRLRVLGPGSDQGAVPAESTGCPASGRRRGGRLAHQGPEPLSRRAGYHSHGRTADPPVGDLWGRGDEIRLSSMTAPRPAAPTPLSTTALARRP